MFIFSFSALQSLQRRGMNQWSYIMLPRKARNKNAIVWTTATFIPVPH